MRGMAAKEIAKSLIAATETLNQKNSAKPVPGWNKRKQDLSGLESNIAELIGHFNENEPVLYFLDMLRNATA